MPLTVNDLTLATLDGTGVFDVLMRANKAHLESEYQTNRIKGPEYATVYLGPLESVMQTSLQFLLNKDKSDLEAQLIQAQIEKVNAEIDLVKQQTANAVIEAEVLRAQKCKLDAEFDVLLQSKLKTATEVTLLAQKTQTEKAQTVAMGVDADSVIGRQKDLYAAQATGFERDAEQKAAKLMIDSWNVRRTTDEGTVADGTNMLNDAAVGRAINKLLAGVAA